MEVSMSVDTTTDATTRLKLARLPDRVPGKILVTVPPELKRLLAAYAELYRETYGEEESVEVLIPFMLEAFLRSDRVMKRRLRRPRARRPRRAAA
jgi:hypothetical protein